MKYPGVIFYSELVCVQLEISDMRDDAWLKPALICLIPHPELCPAAKEQFVQLSGKIYLLVFLLHHMSA